MSLLSSPGVDPSSSSSSSASSSAASSSALSSAAAGASFSDRASGQTHSASSASSPASAASASLATRARNCPGEWFPCLQSSGVGKLLTANSKHAITRRPKKFDIVVVVQVQQIY